MTSVAKELSKYDQSKKYSYEVLKNNPPEGVDPACKEVSWVELTPHTILYIIIHALTHHPHSHPYSHHPHTHIPTLIHSHPH